MTPSILIVDDNPSIVDLCSMILRAEGFEVATAVDARRALDLLRGGVFDVVLTDDVRTPDGGTVARVARALRPHPAVIVMTARPSVDGLRAAVAAGMADYLPKPFQAAQLVETVRRCLPPPAPPPPAISP